MTRIPRTFKLTPALLGAVLLAGCGFHLRQSAALPPAMQQQVYLNVSGGGELPRELTRALQVHKVQVFDSAQPGVAELDVPVAAFSTEVLTATGFARVGEYAVHYHVEFTLKDGSGATVLPTQRLDMQHEFTFDPYQAVGTAAQTEVIERSMVRDMVDAIMRKLEAAGKLGATVPAPSAPSSD